MCWKSTRVIRPKLNIITRRSCNSLIVEIPPLIVFSVVVPRTYLGAIVFRVARNIEHFVSIGAVFNDIAAFVVLPLLIVITRTVMIQTQFAGA